MQQHIFISYARADHVAANGLKDAIARAGRRLWIDTENLRAGGNWADDIEAAIRKASVVVVLLTRRAVASPHVSYEWSFARGAGVPVVPVVMDRVELHPRLSALQCIEAYGMRPRWARVVEQLPRPKPVRNVQVHERHDGPNLIAEFELRAGKPICENDHYAILLGATHTPPGTRRVTYELLDNTFDEDERKYGVPSSRPNFYEHIEVCGDFYIAASGQSRRGKWHTLGTLVAALRRKYGVSRDAPIRRAIRALERA